MRTIQCQTLNVWSTVTVVAVLSVASSTGSAQATSYPSMAPVEQYLMADRNGEIALARSAAPADISSQATVLVLTRRGYETAVKGTNGFVCLVDRGWQAPFDDPEFWNHKVRSPVCLNPQAARSVLPNAHKRTTLALAGRSKAEIMERMKTANGKKEFGSVEIGAMSYMMSKEQYLGDRFARWQPHLMFYIPSTVEGSHWGANVPNSPVVVGPDRRPDGSREPINVFVVPVGHWSDGSPAPADHRPSSQH
jgi:hypothetical protein